MIATASPQSEIRNPKSAANGRFTSLLAARTFPGRKTLYIYEVARVLRVSENQVISWIEEDLLAAINIAGAGNKTERSYYRIPVCEYDAFILRGGNQFRISETGKRT
jgi:hypothetical protein